MNWVLNVPLLRTKLDLPPILTEREQPLFDKICRARDAYGYQGRVHLELDDVDHICAINSLRAFEMELGHSPNEIKIVTESSIDQLRELIARLDPMNRIEPWPQHYILNPPDGQWLD